MSNKKTFLLYDINFNSDLSYNKYFIGSFSDEKRIFEFFKAVDSDDKTSFPVFGVLEVVNNTYDSDEEEKWTWYSIDGKMLFKNSEPWIDIDTDDKVVHKRKFNKGDLVLFKFQEYIQDLPSPFNKPYFGVIAGVPNTKDEYDKEGELLDDRDYSYLIDYIKPNGFLEHIHLYQILIELAQPEDLPNEFRLLNVLSQHYKGAKVLNKSVYMGIVSGSTYVGDTCYWCLKNK